jgi:hypothetical protein
MLKKELEIEIIDLSKKKSILEAQVAEYENERHELVVSAHKYSSDNARLQKEINAVKLISEQNGDVAKRAYSAESKLLWYQIAVATLASLLVYTFIL